MWGTVSSRFDVCVLIIFFSQFPISELFRQVRLAFWCLLWVWQVKTGKENKQVQKARKCPAIHRCSAGSHSTCLIRPLASWDAGMADIRLLFNNLSPYVWQTQCCSEQSISHTRGCHPPLTQIHNQTLQFWFASPGSWLHSFEVSHAQSKNLLFQNFVLPFATRNQNWLFTSLRN